MKSVNNILFIGNSYAAHPMIEWCIAKGLNWKSITPVLQHPVKHIEFGDLRDRNSLQFKPGSFYTHILPFDIFYTAKLFDWFYTQKFVPEWIVCTSDSIEYLEREFTIGQYYNCHNAINREQEKFFTYKSEQDRVCKLLGIPTLPRWSELGQCIKKDFKNSEQRPFAKFRWQPNDYTPVPGEFAQGWVDIKHIIAPDIVVDPNGVWSIFNVNRIHFKNGHSVFEESPYSMTSREQEQVESALQRLSRYLKISCRNLLYEFTQLEGDDTLYNQDFNSRVGGDYHLRQFGKEIGNYNPFLGCFDAREVPETVYHVNQFYGLQALPTYEKQQRREIIIPREKQLWWVDPQATFTWKHHSNHQTIKTIKCKT